MLVASTELASSTYGNLDVYKKQAKLILKQLSHHSELELSLTSEVRSLFVVQCWLFDCQAVWTLRVNACVRLLNQPPPLFVPQAFTFHYIIVDQICIMTLTERSYPRQMAFAYLREVHDRFVQQMRTDFGPEYVLCWRLFVPFFATPPRHGHCESKPCAAVGSHGSVYSVVAVGQCSRVSLHLCCCVCWNRRCSYSVRIATSARPYEFISFDRHIEGIRKKYVDPVCRGGDRDGCVWYMQRSPVHVLFRCSQCVASGFKIMVDLFAWQLLEPQVSWQREQIEDRVEGCSAHHERGWSSVVIVVGRLVDPLANTVLSCVHRSFRPGCVLVVVPFVEFGLTDWKRTRLRTHASVMDGCTNERTNEWIHQCPQNVMVLLKRGEKLGDVAEKSHKLVDDSKVFKGSARRLNLAAQLRKYAPLIAVGFVVIFVFYWKLFL